MSGSGPAAPSTAGSTSTRSRGIRRSPAASCRRTTRATICIRATRATRRWANPSRSASSGRPAAPPSWARRWCRVVSAGLATNRVGDRSVRRVLVYLPPSYAREPARRYPVLYLLHGATSTPEEWLNGVYQGLNLQLALDSLVAAAAIPEFIVVMPDADNALGGDWYANSPATGNWEDFVVRDLVRHVDGHYRTDPTVARRALVGHSMGGFGALAIGFNHPGVFGFIYAVSPCCIGFVGRLAPSGPAWPALSTITRWQTAPDRVRLLVGMAAALDGSRSDPRLFAELRSEERRVGKEG